MRPVQNQHGKSARQDEACDVQPIEVLDHAYEAQTNHKRSQCRATGMREELPGCGINFHASYAALLVQENVVQHKFRTIAAAAKRSESGRKNRVNPDNSLFYARRRA